MRTRRKSKQKSLELKILAMLACFSVSAGLWDNFRQLWLQSNGFAASDVSSITSIGMLVSVVGIILVGRRLKMRHLKAFMTAVLGISLCNLLIMLSLNRSGFELPIKLCVIIDILTSYLIITSVYPLLTTVIKSNHIYSRRKLVEYFFRDIGILLGGIVIGQHLPLFQFDYNSCLLVAIGFQILAVIILSTFKLPTTVAEPDHHASVVKHICRSRLQLCYLLYAFLSSMSFAAAFGLKMLILTNHIGFSDSIATNYLLIVGLIADCIGVFALRRFTPKNDYVTMTIKFGIRLVAYLIAMLANDHFIFLIAITWSLLISTAFEDVSDGHYINLISNRDQFSYSTIKYVMNYLGEALGIMLCGMMFDYGLTYILGLSAIILSVQIVVAYYLIYLRHHSRRLRHSASRMRYNERIAPPDA